MDYFDLSQSPAGRNGPVNSLAAAFAHAQDVKFLVVSFTSDWLYPSHQSKEIVSALTAAGADVSYLDIESSAGPRRLPGGGGHDDPAAGQLHGSAGARGGVV